MPVKFSVRVSVKVLCFFLSFWMPLSFEQYNCCTTLHGDFIIQSQSLALLWGFPFTLSLISHYRSICVLLDFVYVIFFSWSLLILYSFLLSLVLEGRLSGHMWSLCLLQLFFAVLLFLTCSSVVSMFVLVGFLYLNILSVSLLNFL